MICHHTEFYIPSCNCSLGIAIIQECKYRSCTPAVLLKILQNTTLTKFPRFSKIHYYIKYQSPSFNCIGQSYKIFGNLVDKTCFGYKKKTLNLYSVKYYDLLFMLISCLCHFLCAAVVLECV